MKTTYNELQSEIKEILNQDFKSKKIDFIDLMSILWILSQAKNLIELNTLLEVYRKDYSSLDFLLSKSEARTQETITNDIQTLLSAYIKESPDDAKRILAYLKENKSVNPDALFNKFPKFKKFSQ
jgi:hypothetical protein